MLELVDSLAADGIPLAHIDLGGGLGIRYRDETPVPLAEYAAMIVGLFAGRREKLIFEPGRHLVGDAGVLLTRVEYLKPGDPKSFAIVDAAMNDLLRPALYDAWHPVDAGAAPRRSRLIAGTSSVPYAKAATSWRATGRWRSPKETCWPSARRARTAWR